MLHHSLTQFGYWLMQPCRFNLSQPRFVRDNATTYYDVDNNRKYTMFGLVELYHEEQDAHYHYEVAQHTKTKQQLTVFDVASGC